MTESSQPAYTIPAWPACATGFTYIYLYLFCNVGLPLRLSLCGQDPFGGSKHSTLHYVIIIIIIILLFSVIPASNNWE